MAAGATAGRGRPDRLAPPPGAGRPSVGNAGASKSTASGSSGGGSCFPSSTGSSSSPPIPRGGPLASSDSWMPCERGSRSQGTVLPSWAAAAVGPMGVCAVGVAVGRLVGLRVSGTSLVQLASTSNANIDSQPAITLEHLTIPTLPHAPESRGPAWWRRDPPVNGVVAPQLPTVAPERLAPCFDGNLRRRQLRL